MNDFHDIVSKLIVWYEKNARDLPWRRTKNPYHIWLSEIMLQQTRVEAVKPYFQRFIQVCPTIESLASAEEETLLKLWEGLGYYSRVRNLQKAAQTVVEEHGGNLPADYHELRKLKGIGPYTAGAIASIAFSLPYAAVDGNVLRVMSRLTADARDIALASTKKAWEEEITSLMPKGQEGAFTQALMELGATVCLPNGMPKCEVCPVREHCLGYKKNAVLQYPVKSPKKPRTKEFLSVFFLAYNGKIAISKRGEKGLLSGLWQLPNCSREKALPVALNEWGIITGEIKNMTSRKHIFTHIEWHMDCYFVDVKEYENNGFLWLDKETVEKEYALPSAFKKVWEEGGSLLEE
ncbi:A/G-specific adenine glycosylase [Anaerotignum sp. MB30-C6]|uniref:A/G-specific adenine glycosylase n=1 Tax=Anaerotignum sp. MB30-C6 TaxID=3070814 RepID=UPI0027DD55E9|nr:A/G-specific adenine glycosylase [Anaerotignum sp. MB30-C6]WMI82282.1 A/G-specific adenine glycosylase [Anaerotignum sp. MB30-C6]